MADSSCLLSEPICINLIAHSSLWSVKNEPQADGVVLVRRLTVSRTPSMSKRKRMFLQFYILSSTRESLVFILKTKLCYIMDSSLTAPQFVLHRFNSGILTLPQIPKGEDASVPCRWNWTSDVTVGQCSSIDLLAYRSHAVHRRSAGQESAELALLQWPACTAEEKMVFFLRLLRSAGLKSEICCLMSDNTEQPCLKCWALKWRLKGFLHVCLQRPQHWCKWAAAKWQMPKEHKCVFFPSLD